MFYEYFLWFAGFSNREGGNIMESVQFQSSGSMVQGFYFPVKSADSLGTLVFLQGFPGVEGDELICALLAERGLNVLTFNYRGVFGSEGTFSFSHAVEDIGAAVQFVTKSVGTGKIFLGGWSFGSGLVPAGAVRNPQVAKLFTLSGRNFGDEARLIEQDPEYAAQVRQNLDGIRKPAGPVNLADNFLEDMIVNKDHLDSLRLAPLLKDKPILLIGAWDDEISAIEDHIIPFYRRLLENGNGKAKIEAFQTDHEFSGCREQVVEAIINWLMSE